MHFGDINEKGIQVTNIFFHVDSKQQHKNGEKNIKLTAFYEKQDKPKKITTTTTETKNKYNANSYIGVITVSHQWYTK